MVETLNSEKSFQFEGSSSLSSSEKEDDDDEEEDEVVELIRVCS